MAAAVGCQGLIVLLAGEYRLDRLVEGLLIAGFDQVSVPAINDNLPAACGVKCDQWQAGGCGLY